jgi:hypothetical protein
MLIYLLDRFLFGVEEFAVEFAFIVVVYCAANIV